MATTDENRYNSPGKDAARERLREFIRRNYAHPLQYLKVLCLPSPYGREIEDVYTPLRIPMSNIHAAEIDTRLTRLIRKKYPDLGGLYNVDVCDDLLSIRPACRFNIVSLDLCDPFRPQLFSQLLLAARAEMFGEKLVLSITTMKGREPQTTTVHMNELMSLYTSGQANEVERADIVRYAVLESLGKGASFDVMDEEHVEYENSSKRRFLYSSFCLRRRKPILWVYQGPKANLSPTDKQIVRKLVLRGLTTPKITSLMPHVSPTSVASIRAAITRSFLAPTTQSA